MKSQKFYDLVEKFFDECMEIMKSKGQAYSGVEDKLGNFKRVAKNLAMTPEQIWFVYFSKHLDALSSYMRGEYNDSEPIFGRIQDMINYLFLLYGLIVEKEMTEKELEEGYKKKADMLFIDPDDWGDPNDVADSFEGDITVTEDGENKDE